VQRLYQLIRLPDLLTHASQIVHAASEMCNQMQEECAKQLYPDGVVLQTWGDPTKRNHTFEEKTPHLRRGTETSSQALTCKQLISLLLPRKESDDLEVRLRCGCQSSCPLHLQQRCGRTSQCIAAISAQRHHLHRQVPGQHETGADAEATVARAMCSAWTMTGSGICRDVATGLR
jgi:hypothetical protein